MNDCAKYQHPKKKLYFLKNHKIAFFTFFEGLKKWALLKKKNLNFFSMF